MYSIDNRESFDLLQMWLDEVNSLVGINIPKILIGNKSDLECKRRVNSDEGAAFATKHGMVFMEASAKEDRNVSESFMELTKEMIKNVKIYPKEFMTLEKKGIVLKRPNDENKSKCCSCKEY